MHLSSFLEDNALSDDFGPILVVAHDLPQAFRSYTGPLVFIGRSAPEGRISSRDYVAIIRETSFALLDAMKKYCEGSRLRFALVYIDEHHTMDIIVRQINLAAAVAHPACVYVFPGAVPPERGMGSAAPSQAWWVGDVWTLSSVLAMPGAVIKTCELQPVGALFAQGISVLDERSACDAAARLQREISSSAFTTFFNHTTLSGIGTWLADALDPLRSDGRLRVVFESAATDIIRSTVIDEEFDWERPPPDFVVDLSRAERDFTFLRAKRRFHGVRLDEFANVSTHGRDVLLGRPRPDSTVGFYGKNFEPGAAANWAHHMAREDTNPADIATAFTAKGRQIYLSKEHLKSAVDLDESVFLATPDEFPNFGMWLLYSIPNVHFYKSQRGRYKKMLASTIFHWQKKMLVDLGVDEGEIIDQKLDRVYNVRELAVVRHSFRSLGISSTDRDIFDRMADRAVSQAAKGPDRIFISRLSKTKEGGHRGLVNEASLIEKLRELDIVAVEPERYSILEQARLFRNASLVIGLGGAAMFNVAFCRPGTQVIDIESDVGFVDVHCNLFASRGVRYGIILGEPDSSDPSMYQKSWRLDVDRAISVIKSHI